jgi:membrane-bound serine protease (ClpP class)
MDPLFWSIALLIASLLVICIEMFVPSAGLLGLLAAVLMVSAIILAFFNSMLAGVIMIGAVAISLPFIFMLFVRIWPSTPIGRRVMISSPPDMRPTGEQYEAFSQLIGRRGVARTRMLPSGQVLIDGKSYDAVSQGTAVEAGDPIEVIACRTYRIIVRRISEDELANPGPAIDPDDLLSRPVDEFLE